MSKKIFKYTLRDQTYTLEMPFGADILSAHAQGDEICLWALVDTKVSVTEARTFKVFATGVELDESIDNMIFIGTTLAHGGRIVFHVFEVQA